MINRSIYEYGDGGQLLFKNNDIAATVSFFNIAYLKMFGGNVKESTSPETNTEKLYYDWWGNNSEENSNTWINSETERTLRGISLTSSSIEKIKSAVKNDISTLTDYGSTTVDVMITDINRLEIKITLSQGDNLKIIWDSSKNEVIEKIIL